MRNIFCRVNDREKIKKYLLSCTHSNSISNYDNIKGFIDSQIYLYAESLIKITSLIKQYSLLGFKFI